MKIARILNTTGVLAMVSLLGSSIPAVAGQINSICKTDDQTFKAIKASADQTLWLFMQSVCRGEFVITQSSETTRSPDYAQSLPPVDAPQDVLWVDSSKGAPSPLVPPASTAQATPTNLSDGKPPGASVFKDPGPKEVEPSEVLAVSPETPKATQPALTPIPNATSTVGSVAVNESPMVENSPIVIAPSAESVPIPSDGFKSKQPTRYSLLASQIADTFVEELPAPITYRPSRFSNYKPDYLMESTASNYATGFFQKPAVMSVVPHGFYIGSSLFINRGRGVDARSALPSLILGFSDERAVREFQTYPGLGSRIELQLQRLKYNRISTRWSEVGALGEVYIPLGGGLFSGLGGKYEFSDGVPLPGEGRYDDEFWSLYLPIGAGFTTSMGQSGKIQLNTLLAARSKSKLSQLTSASYSNPTAKLRFGEAFGLDYSFSWNPNLEVFANLWRYHKSIPYSYTEDGVQVNDRTPKQWSLDAGFRYYW